MQSTKPKPRPTAQLQDTLSPFELQSQVIKSALLQLAGLCDGASARDGQGFNGADSVFGHNLATTAKNWGLSPRQEFEACKMMRKYWRQLKKADIVLPKPYLNRYSINILDDEQATVTNESKGSEYKLIRDSWGDYTCECEAASNGNECGHVSFARGAWAFTPPPEPEPLPDDIDHQYQLYIVDDECATITGMPNIQHGLLRTSWDKITCTCGKDECAHIEFAKDNWPRNDSPDEPVADYLYWHGGEEPVTYSPPRFSEYANGTKESELEILPGIFATQGQSNALDDLMEFANGGNTLHLLSGFAGTGKSLLLQAWLKRLRDGGYNGPIVFTAPTNKATEVLRGMTSRWGLNVECVTCAKLLGLRPVINRETGKEEFKKNYSEDSVIQDYDIVVVDESSMVGEELFGYLAEEANILTKILFVGDWAQLPPVGEPISRAFLDIKQQSALTEVKRYSGAISVVADDLRRNLARRGEPLIETDRNPEKTQGTFVLEEDDWKKKLIRAFKSEKSQQDPNYCRALAWRNKTVESLNKYIRESIQGENAPRFVVGERLLANEHYGIKGLTGKPKTLFAASAEMEVLSIFEGTVGEWDAWFLDVIMLDSEGMRYTIPVLHENHLAKFEATQKKIKQGALKGEKHLWDRYSENRKLFAWVDYAYAMTVHKSQGSTFNNVFIDMGDIMADTSKAQVIIPGGDKQLIYERNQLLYVAITRASDRIFIFE